MVTPTGPEPFPHEGLTAPWAMVEQDTAGHWWVTVTDTTSTTAAGPFLDEVQALRVLLTWELT